MTPLIAVVLCGCEASAPEPKYEAPRSSTSDTVAPPTASPSAPSRPSSVPITEVENLIGEYRIAGVDERDIDLPHGITARISDVAIIVEADCLVLSWSYFFEGTSLVTEQLFARDSCGRKLLPEEQAIVTAFNSANDVGRTPANGIEFSGGGHSVLLFSQ